MHSSPRVASRGSPPPRAVPFPPNFGAGAPARIYHDDGSELLFSIASLNRSVAPGPAPEGGYQCVCSCCYALTHSSPRLRSCPCYRNECELCCVPTVASLNRRVAPGPAQGEGSPYMCSCYYALDLLSPQLRSGPCHRSECEFCDVPTSNARSRGVGAPIAGLERLPSRRIPRSVPNLSLLQPRR